jgi:AcrR family transcriptional regulator
VKGKAASVRERLLDAAERLFNHYSIHGTSVDTIASEAEAAKMSLYHEFGSKLNLLLAVLERLDERWTHQLQISGHRPAPNDEEHILAIFDLLHDWFSEPDFQGCIFIKAAGDFGNANHAVRQLVFRHKERIQNFIEEICEGAGYGDRTLARRIYLLVNGAIVTAMIEGNPAAAIDAKEAAKSLLRSCRTSADEAGNPKKALCRSGAW